MERIKRLWVAIRCALITLLNAPVKVEGLEALASVKYPDRELQPVLLDDNRIRVKLRKIGYEYKSRIPKNRVKNRTVDEAVAKTAFSEALKNVDGIIVDSIVDHEGYIELYLKQVPVKPRQFTGREMLKSIGSYVARKFNEANEAAIEQSCRDADMMALQQNYWPIANVLFQAVNNCAATTELRPLNDFRELHNPLRQTGVEGTGLRVYYYSCYYIVQQPVQKITQQIQYQLDSICQLIGFPPLIIAISLDVSRELAEFKIAYRCEYAQMIQRRRQHG